MLFLKDIVGVKDNEINVSLKNEDTLSDEDENLESNDATASDNTYTPIPLTLQYGRKRKRQHQNNQAERQLLEIEAKRLEILQTSEDENFLFLKSLVPYFKQLNCLQQLRVRTRFQEILMEELSEIAHIQI